MSRVQALERYRELPLPDTTEEHWRFTDLKGFDPDSFGQVPGSDPGSRPGGTMLDLDVAGRWACEYALDNHPQNLLCRLTF